MSQILPGLQATNSRHIRTEPQGHGDKTLCAALVAACEQSYSCDPRWPPSRDWRLLCCVLWVFWICPHLSGAHGRSAAHEGWALVMDLTSRQDCHVTPWIAQDWTWPHFEQWHLEFAGGCGASSSSPKTRGKSCLLWWHLPKGEVRNPGHCRDPAQPEAEPGGAASGEGGHRGPDAVTGPSDGPSEPGWLWQAELSAPWRWRCSRWRWWCVAVSPAASRGRNVPSLLQPGVASTACWVISSRAHLPLNWEWKETHTTDNCQIKWPWRDTSREAVPVNPSGRPGRASVWVCVLVCVWSWSLMVAILVGFPVSPRTQNFWFKNFTVGHKTL